MSRDPKSRPSFTPSNRWKIGGDMVVRTLLVLAVAVMVNYLGAKFYHRFYLSSQTQMKLSTRTVAVLHSLTNHVEVTLYYDRTAKFYPDILQLLNEYRAMNKDISIRTVDYMADPGAAELVKEKYHLPSSVAAPGSPPSKDLIIFDGGKGKQPIVVPGDEIVQYTLVQTAPDNPNQKELQFRRKPVEFNGEVLFTAKLLAIENAHPFKAYFLQGHGEPSLTDTGDSGYSKFGLALAQNDLIVDNLQLLGDQPVPADCNLLVIAAPVSPLPQSELEKISQYLDQGGRLLMLFNYASLHQPTGLESIMQHWGVNVASTYVQDPQNSIGNQVVVVRHFNPKSFVNPLTQLALEMVLPRPITRVNWANPPANAPEVTALVASSNGSMLAGEPTAAPRSYPLITSVEQKPAVGVSNSRGNARIVVAGDSLFLDNQIIGAAANHDFINYAANWLLERPQLLKGVRPRPVVEYRLLLTNLEEKRLSWLILGALPGGVLVLGWLVWLMRRQ